MTRVRLERVYMPRTAERGHLRHPKLRNQFSNQEQIVTDFHISQVHGPGLVNLHLPKPKRGVSRCLFCVVLHFGGFVHRQAAASSSSRAFH